jgi:hypothetical protein
MTRPFEGIRIIDATHVLGRAFCNTDSVLAEHGDEADRIAAFRRATVI